MQKFEQLSIPTQAITRGKFYFQLLKCTILFSRVYKIFYYMPYQAFDVSVEFLDIMPWEIQNYIKRRDCFTWDIGKFRIFGFHWLYIMILKIRKTVVNELWPEALVEPCFWLSFFLFKLLVMAHKVYNIWLNYDKILPVSVKLIFCWKHSAQNFTVSESLYSQSFYKSTAQAFSTY